MKLDKGLHQDSSPEEQPYGTYRWALNWVRETQGALTTEHSAKRVAANIPGTIIGCIALPSQLVVFSVGTSSEIGVYSELTDTYTPLLNDTIVATLGGSGTNLNFQADREIRGIYRYNSKSEIEIVWTDAYNKPRVMYLPDVDRPGTPLDTIAKYYNNYDVNKLNVFQDVTQTEATWEVVQGGSLPVDTYAVYYRYLNKDFSGTGYYSVGEGTGIPIYIDSSPVGTQYKVKANSDLGSVTSKAIKVTFTLKDTSYSYIEIGLWKASVNEVVSVATISIDTPSYTIESIDGETVSGGITNLLADIYRFKTVQTLTSLDQQLYLGGLTSEKLEFSQKWANAVKVNWRCKWLDFSSTDVDFKNPNTVFKTFQAGEVYAFYIRAVKDNVASDWFHIPGREVKPAISVVGTDLGGDLFSASYAYPENIMNKDIDDPGLGGDPRLFQIVNNSIAINEFSKYYQTHDALDWGTVTGGETTDENTGEFCFWENTNDPYSAYFTTDDLEIGETNVFITGTDNVRHHKFPSYSSLQRMQNKYAMNGSDFRNRTEFADTNYDSYSPAFCSVIPQLGVDIDLSDVDVASDYDYFEIGYAKRTSTDCTIVATDIALFGQYQPERIGFQRRNGSNCTGGTGYIFSNTTEREQALLFTGGNFNNQSGAAFFTGLTNGSWIKRDGDAYNERVPERQHVHTPDLVDQVDFDNDALGTLVDYVEHELIMSTLNLVSNKAHTNPSSAFSTVDDGNRLNVLLDQFSSVVRFNKGADTNFRSMNADGSARDNRFRYNGTNNRAYVFDYTVPTILPNQEYDKWAIKLVNATESYMARSDDWYPDAFKKRPVSKKFYVARNTGTQTIDGVQVYQGFLGPKGIQGSSNHLHLVLNNNEEEVLQPLDFSVGTDWSQNSIIGHAAPLARAGANLRTTRFMSLCSDWVPGYNGADTSTEGVTTYYGDFRHNTFLTTLRRFKENMYVGLADKEILITESRITDVATIYQGDMFLSDVSYMTTGTPSMVGDNEGNTNGSTTQYTYANTNNCIFRFIAPTRKNFNYRKTGTTSLTQFNQFYPNAPFDRTLGVNIFIGETDMNGTLKPLAMLLDSEFNTQNSLYFNSFVYTKTAEFLTTFPFRILQSLTQAKESSVNNWRSFPATNYYDIDKVKGYIVNLQGYDDRLLVHTNQTLFQSRGIGTLDTGDNAIVIGNGGVFNQPLQEVMFDSLGYVGTQHQHSCYLTKSGYVFADTVRGKVFVYVKDNLPQEVSALGMYKYFREYLKVERDDTDAGLSPVHVSYDHKYSRLLLTCKGDGTTEPFTISFDGQWVSFHSYVPDIAVNTSTMQYSVHDDELWQHSDTSTVLTYGDGAVDAEIDVTCNTQVIMDKNGNAKIGNQSALKQFQAFNWRTIGYDTVSGKQIPMSTFKTARVYTENQLSELVTLQHNLPYSGGLPRPGNIRQYNGVWNFNKFRDSLNRVSLQTVQDFIENPNKGYKLDVSNVSINSANFVRRFVDRYAIIRLTAEPGEEQIKVLDVDANFKQVTK